MFSHYYYNPKNFSFFFVFVFFFVFLTFFSVFFYVFSVFFFFNLTTLDSRYTNYTLLQNHLHASHNLAFRGCKEICINVT
jgi:hypothetical protein